MAIQLSDHFSYRKLLRFALPSILMMVFTSVYGVVDGFFISNYAGKTPFAAINFIIPFLMILGSLGFMIGTGGCALIGKTMGEGDVEKANRYFSMFVYVTLAAGVVFAALGMIFVPQVARLLGADDSMLAICVQYSRIVLLGLPFIMLQYEFQSFFVVAEKPNVGFIVTLVSGGSNMVLDWLLVGVFSFGVVGAAAATVISQIVGGVIPLFYFTHNRTGLLRLGKPYFNGWALRQTLWNGFSEFVSNISMSVVSMLYNGQLIKYAGEDGVAAYGVLMYVNMIFLAIFIGYAVGTAPIISYHFGAQNSKELKNVFHKSLLIIGISAVLMLLAGECCSGILATLFVGYDETLMALTVRAFAFFSFSFLFASVPIYGSSFFTALNNGGVSAAISFLRTVVFQVAAVLIFPLIWEIDGIWLSLVAAEFVAAAVTVAFWVIKQKKYNY